MDSLRLPRFRLSLLGPLELEDSTGPVPLTNGKAAGLIAVLACTAPTPQSRGKLIELLWGDQPEALARQNLRQALTTLRRILGEDALATGGQTVSLRTDLVACDVGRFEVLALDGSHDALKEAVALYRDRFLADMPDVEDAWAEWMMEQRRRLEGLALDAMVRLSEQELATGNAMEGLAVARRSLSIDDLREDAHRLVIRALTALGRRADALKQYDEVREILRRELDVEPDVSTQALAAELRRDRPPEAPTAVNETVVRLAATNATDAHPGVAKAIASVSQAPRPLSRWPQIAHPAVGHRVALSAIGAAILLGIFALILSPRIQPASIEATPRESASRHDPSDPSEGLVSIAILPLVAIGGREDSRVHAEQMTATLVNRLSRFNVLRVRPAPQPAFASDKDGRAGPNGRYVLGGSISAEGESFRLNVSLSNARSGAFIWSRDFTEQQNRWASAQEDIIRRITFAVNVEAIRAAAREPAAPEAEPTVRQLLIRGWASVLSGLPSSEPDASRDIFREVLRRDPEAHGAQIGLAGYYLLGVAFQRLKPDPYLEEAETLLRRAFVKKPNNHGVHFYLGILHFIRGNHAAAVQAFDRAIELNPSHAPAYARKGRALARLQQYEEAIFHIDYALRLAHGMETVWHLWKGWAELEDGRDGGARQSFEIASATQPRSPYVHASLAAAYALRSEWPQARVHVAKLRKLTPELSDQERLVEFSKNGGRGSKNRLGTGLRLALQSAEM